MSTHCSSCGKEWVDHLGIAGTCEDLTKALKRIEALEEMAKELLEDSERFNPHHSFIGNPHYEILKGKT